MHARLGIVAASAITLGGCQLVFGLDGYGPGNSGGAGVASATSSSAGGAGGGASTSSTGGGPPAWTTITGPADLGGQFYPAVSPDNSVILYSRYVGQNGPYRVFMTTKSGADYGAPKPIPGLDNGVAGDAWDFRAQPIW